MVSAVRRSIRAGTYGRASGLENFSSFVDKVFLPYAREHHSDTQNARHRCEVLKAEFGRRKLRDVTAMRVQTFVKKRLNTTTVRADFGPGGRRVARRRSPTTVRKEFALLKQVFNMARPERLVSENPCDFVRKSVLHLIPARRRRERAMTLEEERLLLPQLSGRRWRLLPAVRVAQWTGMRRGEILRLEKRELNFSDRDVIREVADEKYSVPPGRLFIQRSKNGKPRAVPMRARVRTLLADLCGDATTGPYVFGNPRTGRAVLDIKKGYAAAVKAAGIPHLTFYDLLHTWSTRAEELGVPEAVRRGVLGHSPRTMTASYTHSYREARERAVELVSRYGEALTNAAYVKNAEGPTLWLASRTA